MAYRLGNRILKIDNKLFYAEGVSPVNPVWSGLTSYWRFDETSGTVAYDSKGSVNGTLKAGSWNANGKNNYCWYNTASPNLGMTFGNNFNFERTDTFSFSLWIKINNTGTFNVFFTKQDGTGLGVARRGYFFAINNANQIYYQIVSANNTSNMINCNQIGSFTNNVWYHIAYTYNGTSKASGSTIYINGNSAAQNVATDNLTGSIVSNAATKCSIGGYNDGTIFSTKGYIDEFAIWNRVLSQDEVTALYNSGNGLFY